MAHHHHQTTTEAQAQAMHVPTVVTPRSQLKRNHEGDLLVDAAVHGGAASHRGGNAGGGSDSGRLAVRDENEDRRKRERSADPRPSAGPTMGRGTAPSSSSSSLGVSAVARGGVSPMRGVSPVGSVGSGSAKRGASPAVSGNGGVKMTAKVVSGGHDRKVAGSSSSTTKASSTGAVADGRSIAPTRGGASPRPVSRNSAGTAASTTSSKVGSVNGDGVRGVARPVQKKIERDEVSVGSRDLDDDSDEDDDESDDSDAGSSLLDDALDDVELRPYLPPEGEGLSDATIARLHKELRSIGPEVFLRQYLASRESRMPSRRLGTAFGIDPDIQIGDDIYLRLLGRAVIRAYQKRQKLTEYNTIDDAAALLQKSKNVMVITGAGISTSLGIPDFRSKGTGFYEKLREKGYQDAEEVFEIHEFDRDPSLFYSLAGDILPSMDRFTPTHAFIRLLQDQGRLQTNYTQNIDNLEELAGIDKIRLIQCHGSFATATCRKCKHQVPGSTIFPDIRAGRVTRCKACTAALASKASLPAATKKKRRPKKPHTWNDDDLSDSSTSSTAYTIPEPGVMKPDITFFGEQLPDNFFDRFTSTDSQTVDLVIVIGTSLKVAPVSEMSNYLPHHVPHVYISREPIEHVNFDVQLLGDCDHVVFELCRRAGWVLRHEMVPEGFAVVVKEVEGGGGARWKVVPKEGSAVGGGSGLVKGDGANAVIAGRASPSPQKLKTGVVEAGRSPRRVVPGQGGEELRPFYEKYLGKG